MSGATGTLGDSGGRREGRSGGRLDGEPAGGALAGVQTANLILYCARWGETVRFYRDALGLPVLMANDWFVELALSPNTRLSIADERRATIKSCGGAGMTVALEVADLTAAWAVAQAEGLQPTEISEHPWDARVFHLFDPEGHRVEVWQRR